jgi:hypothetical protein
MPSGERAGEAYVSLPGGPVIATLNSVPVSIGCSPAWSEPSSITRTSDVYASILEGEYVDAIEAFTKRRRAQEMQFRVESDAETSAATSTEMGAKTDAVGRE